MTLPLPPGARLTVSLSGRPLCAIAVLDDGRTALQWTPEALQSGDDAGANVALRQAPLLAGVHRVGSRELDGLPGFLADSLPDGWGRLLVDRQLRRHGVDGRSLRGLDRLAVVGGRGPGALTYAPEAPLSDPGAEEHDLDHLAAEAELVLDGGDASILDALERAGGSAGGSRPKAWLAVHESGRLRSGASELSPGETGWLVKFRSKHHDPKDIGPIEYAYARMAQAAGLEVAEPRLFETSCGRYFASLRFDRRGSERVHVLTAAGLLGIAAERAVAADYVDLIALTRHVTRSEAQARDAYRHAVFNVLTHNRDDHLRQFAFCRSDHVWTRSPAYDLSESAGPGGEHTLLVAGEGRRPTKAHLEALAARSGIPPRVVRSVLDEVRAAAARWAEFAAEAGVSTGSTRRISEAIAAAAG